MKKGILGLFVIICIVTGKVYGSVESDIKYIRNNMVTKTEFQLYVKMADNRFEDMNKRFEDMNKRFEDMNKYMDKRFQNMNKRLGVIEGILIILIGVVTGLNLYSIIKQNRWYAIRVKLEREITELKEEQEKLKEIVIEIAKKDKNLFRKLKLAGFL